MEALYVIAERSTFTQVSGNDNLTEFISGLLAKRECFKVLCLDNNQDFHEDIPYYEPSYNSLLLYSLKDSPEFKDWISSKETFEPTVWRNNKGKIAVPPWVAGDALEEQEWLIKAARAIKKSKVRERKDLIKRTLDEAPDTGTIDTIEQFSIRFPKENPEDFQFEQISNQNLIDRYGECEKWWKTGYDVPYFGNAKIHDEDGFEMFPKQFYQFQRK